MDAGSLMVAAKCLGSKDLVDVKRKEYCVIDLILSGKSRYLLDFCFHSLIVHGEEVVSLYGDITQASTMHSKASGTLKR
jgi:hypothetical protein